MFPILPILAWTGGIAAGAQVLGGIVRGTGELVRGRPGSAMREVAGGCVAPVKTVCVEVSKLGRDMYGAVMAPWSDEPELDLPAPPATKRRRSTNSTPPDQSLNGVATAGVES
jgi:hypothetical protein